LRAGPACTQVDRYEAVCRGGYRFVVRAGDADDRVTLDVPPPPREPLGAYPPVHRVDGGPGDDVLLGSEGPDELIGGGGRDTLLGGDGFDELADGDGFAPPDADVLDGGAGSDSVAYDDRLAPVTIDLAAQTAGAAGEADRVIAVERASGGAGADRVFGDAGPNGLSGGPGNDLIAGRDGRDGLQAGDTDADVLLGGAGDDSIDSVGERSRILCGDGDDLVAVAGGPVRPGEDCERALGGADVLRLHLPLAGEGAPIVTMLSRRPACQGCWTSTGIKVRAVRGRHAGRLVASVGEAPRLNALGRRLLRADGRLVVDVRVFGVWVRLDLRRPAGP
jgi:Ca2+-binding RTX toxin-like protein